MNAVVTLPERRERPLVIDAVPVLDSGRFEQMQRIASVMARSPLVPESLRCEAEGQGPNRKVAMLAPEVALANCFLVVNQAVRWGLDPFAVAQCCSVVHGRLMYEGKLVAAVLDAKLGVQLSYAWNDRTGDAFGIQVRGPKDRDGNDRVISGTVGDWKTSGNNSPWGKPANHRKMLAYRGSREWVRLYEPAILLGVYTPDELGDMQETARETRGLPFRQIQDTAPRAVPAGPPRRIAVAAPPAKVETTQVSEAEADAEAEACVTQFEADVQHARSEQDIEGCVGIVAPLEEADRLSREQRQRIEIATEAARARIAAEAQPTDDDIEELAVDPSDPDFQRGQQDRRDGLKKCVIAAIRESEERFPKWKAGYDSLDGEVA